VPGAGVSWLTVWAPDDPPPDARRARLTGIVILAGGALLFAAVAVLTARTATLHLREGVAIAFGATMALAAGPVLAMAWRGRIDLVARMQQAGSTGAGGRRWARAWPAIMIAFALGGAGIAAQEVAQWQVAHGHRASAWELAGRVALGACAAALLTSVCAALSGRPRWAFPPQVRSEREVL
jgi:hypothetical protein